MVGYNDLFSRFRVAPLLMTAARADMLKAMLPEDGDDLIGSESRDATFTQPGPQ